jgi:hypothetical protein
MSPRSILTRTVLAAVTVAALAPSGASAASLGFTGGHRFSSGIGNSFRPGRIGIIGSGDTIRAGNLGRISRGPISGIGSGGLVSGSSGGSGSGRISGGPTGGPGSGGGLVGRIVPPGGLPCLEDCRPHLPPTVVWWNAPQPMPQQPMVPCSDYTAHGAGLGQGACAPKPPARGVVWSEPKGLEPRPFPIPIAQGCSVLQWEMTNLMNDMTAQSDLAVADAQLLSALEQQIAQLGSAISNLQGQIQDLQQQQQQLNDEANIAQSLGQGSIASMMQVLALVAGRLASKLQDVENSLQSQLNGLQQQAASITASHDQAEAAVVRLTAQWYKDKTAYQDQCT